MVPHTLEPSIIRAFRPEREHGCLPSPLYVSGRLEALAAPTVALVGTRAPSDTGRRFAHDLARDLGRAGICLISGLARGIDAAAHRGALAARAPTIGVLGGGHAKLYPREHHVLAAEMIEGGGAVVSAYAPEELPFPSRFLARNGLIVSLADAVVIIEAPARSGALNTASWAADANIPVLAVPGDVDRPKVAGCLALLRDGATLVRNAADVLEALGIASAAPARTRRPQTINMFDHAHAAARAVWPATSANDASDGRDAGTQREYNEMPETARRIHKLLDAEPASAENLSYMSGFPVAVVLRNLTWLVMNSLVVENTNGTYANMSNMRASIEDGPREN